MFSIPLAAVGAILALKLSGSAISVVVFIGLIMADAGQAREYLEQVGFLDGPAAEIGRDRFRDLRAVIADERLEGAQAALARGVVGRAAAHLRVAQAGVLVAQERSAVRHRLRISRVLRCPTC